MFKYHECLMSHMGDWLREPRTLQAVLTLKDIFEILQQELTRDVELQFPSYPNNLLIEDTQKTLQSVLTSKGIIHTLKASAGNHVQIEKDPTLTLKAIIDTLQTQAGIYQDGRKLVRDIEGQFAFCPKS